MMKSFARLEKSPSYRERVFQRRANIDGSLLNGQNAQRFVGRVFRVERQFVGNLKMMSLSEPMKVIVMQMKSQRTNESVTDLKSVLLNGSQDLGLIVPRVVAAVHVLVE